MIRTTLTALGLISLLAWPQSSHANQLVNGDFDTGPGKLPGFYFNVGTQYPTNFVDGWTVTQGNVDWTNNCCLPPQGGTNAIDLVGDANVGAYGTSPGGIGGLSQQFSTVAGQTYELSFWVSRNFGANFGTLALASALVQVMGNNLLYSNTVVHSDPVSVADPNWQFHSAAFVADSLLTNLTFTSQIAGFNGGIYLDTVSVDPVAAVPLPAALPLFASGL